MHTGAAGLPTVPSLLMRAAKMSLGPPAFACHAKMLPVAHGLAEKRYFWVASDAKLDFHATVPSVFMRAAMPLPTIADA